MLDGVDWGKIGTQLDEYTTISELHDRESIARDHCLIPGNLAADINALPDDLINPTTMEKYGKYSVIPSGTKWSSSYVDPYIHKDNLDNNLGDRCFVPKDSMTNHAGKLIWGKKQQYGGDYGKIGGWHDYLSDGEKRYGKIKTATNDGWVGQIGDISGKYGKIGFITDNPTGYRWVLFTPEPEDIVDTNPNIINKQELSNILLGNNEYTITKSEFDNLGITVTKNSLIKGAQRITNSFGNFVDAWYKPVDKLFITSGYCDYNNNTLMDALELDIEEQMTVETAKMFAKYWSNTNDRFVPTAACPTSCTEDSKKNPLCDPCFKKGINRQATEEWDTLATSINNNHSGLDTLISDCQNNLQYATSGSLRPKKIADDYKTFKFKQTTTQPSGHNIVDDPRNPNLDTSKLYQFIFENATIDVDKWNSLKISIIEPNDFIYKPDVFGPNNYYIIDNELFLDIIKDYSDKYDLEYRTEKETLPNCPVPWNYIKKQNDDGDYNNICTTANHQCRPRDNITTSDYDNRILDETNSQSTWYQEKYEIGAQDARDKLNTYWDISGVTPIGPHGQTCVPSANTKATDGTPHVPAGQCPDSTHICRNTCPECTDETKECKTDDISYSQQDFNEMKTANYSKGYALGKSKYLNTYDGVTPCNPENYVSAANRVRIGDDAACTGGQECDSLDAMGWNTILESVRTEKQYNEGECQKVSQRRGTNQKTCLKQCEDDVACNLNFFNKNTAKGIV